MNPWALGFLICAFTILPFALWLGGINGLTVLGVTCAIEAILIQTLKPRKANR